MRGKKFQQQFQTWIYFSALSGLYPPGFEVLVKNIWTRRFFYAYSWLVVFIASLYLIFFLFLVLCTNVFSTFALLLQYFRRCLACAPLLLKIIYHALPVGYQQMSEIYDTWNNVINVGFYVDKRDKLFAKGMRKSRNLFFFVIFFSAGILQLPTIALFTGRHVRGANLAYFPHDPYAWYHFYLVGMQFLNFFLGAFSSFSFNMLSYVIMLMANTQLEILRDGLKDIFQNGFVVNDKERRFQKSVADVHRARKKLKEWIIVHQKTNKWLEEIKTFFRFTSGVKFVFLGWYICLAIFSMPRYIFEGRMTEIVFILSYTIGNYTLLFFESRLADKLRETSGMLFMETYDTSWFEYPRDIRQSLQIIQSYTVVRPVRIRSLGIIYDNSATFLEIMKAAYQMLSFLLQIELF